MKTNRDVHLVVLETLSDWEPGLAIAHLNRSQTNPTQFRVRTVGLGSAPVRTKGGVTILPDLTVDQLRPADSAMMILPGADIWMEPRTDAALTKAREFVAARVPVAAICGATQGLARVGLLDTRRHTSNQPDYLAMTGYSGGAYYVNEPVVEADGVITAAAMASLEFARAILARLDVLPAIALEAWYNLFKTGDARYYAELMHATGAEASS